MDKIVRLSIIVPAYNVEKYLEQCIESCEHQDVPQDEFEVIIINDGSKDNTLEVAHSLAEKYSNIIVVDQENQGQAVARNKGLDMARGKYVMFVDSDDYLIEHKIGKLLDKQEKLGIEALMFGIIEELHDGDTKIYPNRSMEYEQIYSGEEIALNYNIFGSMCAGLFKTSLFIDKNLRFEKGFAHEDSDLCFRLYPCIKSIFYVEDCCYFYRYNDVSTDRNNNRKNVKRSIESDAIIASRVKQLARSGCFSKAISNRYDKIANSMMVAYFLNVRKEKLWNKSEIEGKLLSLKNRGVYPIVGRCCSWKTTILSKILNMEWLIKHTI